RQQDACLGLESDAMTEMATGMRDTDLHALCVEWPGVVRSVKWEVDLVYSVGGRMFVTLCTLGPERGRLSFKVDADRYVELSGQPGMAPAHYAARVFWVSVTEPERFEREQLSELVRRSYNFVLATFPPRVRKAPTP
ncbi:MAG: MmcQ/YjbR family DNA-binding protein, partial [Steroidobacteraceae bacterium]